MSDVHISHHSSDRALAERLASALKNNGIQAKWSAPIARADFGRLVPEALDGCKIVLVLWSRAATNDDQVLEEASYSLAKGKLIAARLEDMRIPPVYGSAPAVDLVEWDGGSRHELFGSLLKLIESKMGRKPEDIRQPVAKTRAGPLETGTSSPPGSPGAPLASAPMPQQPFRAQPLPSSQPHSAPPQISASEAAQLSLRAGAAENKQPFKVTPSSPTTHVDAPASEQSAPSQFSHKFRSMDSLPPEGIQFGAVRSTPLGPVIPDPPPDSEPPPVTYTTPASPDAPAPWTRVKPTHAAPSTPPPTEPQTYNRETAPAPLAPAPTQVPAPEPAPEPIRAEPPRPIEPPRPVVPPPPPAQPYVPKVFVPPTESAPWQKHLDRFAPNKAAPLPERAPPPPPEEDPHWRKYIERWEDETPPGWITAPPAPPPPEPPPPVAHAPTPAPQPPPRVSNSGDVWKKRFERMIAERAEATKPIPPPLSNPPVPTPPPAEPIVQTAPPAAPIAQPTPALRVTVQNQARAVPKEELRLRLAPDAEKEKAKDESAKKPSTPANDLGPKSGTDDLLVALFVDNSDKPPIAPPPFEHTAASANIAEKPPRHSELDDVVLPSTRRRKPALRPLTLVAAGAGALVLGAGSAAFLILKDGKPAPSRSAVHAATDIPTPIAAAPLAPAATAQQPTAESHEPQQVLPEATAPPVQTASVEAPNAAAVAAALSPPPASATVQPTAASPAPAQPTTTTAAAVSPPAAVPSPVPSGVSEAEAFAAATSANTVESYWTYLQNYRSGANAQEAIRRRQALYAERVRGQFESLEPETRAIVDRARRAARTASQEAALARSLTGQSGGTVAEFAVGASLPDGATYEGDWVGGVATGHGSARLRTGGQYLGAFTANQRTGVGVLTYANGSRYEGEFADNRPTGRGVFWDAQGRRVTGSGLFRALTGN